MSLILRFDGFFNASASGSFSTLQNVHIKLDYVATTEIEFMFEL